MMTNEFKCLMAVAKALGLNAEYTESTQPAPETEDSIDDPFLEPIVLNEQNHNKRITQQIGDTVRMKSGGPVMTVVNLGVEHPLVQCAYFQEISQDITNNTVYTPPNCVTFPSEALEIVQENQ